MSCQLHLFLPESRSLKDKRQVLSSLKGRIHNRFEVAVAEVEHTELWQRSTLGVAAVSSEFQHANEVISSVVRFVGQDLRVQLLDYSVQEH
ncbi:MAG: DUF503 domain-containing protein [Candidatus Latescibacterota bacterium]